MLRRVRQYAVVSTPIGDVAVWGEDQTVMGLGFADSPRTVRVDAAWPRDDGAFPRTAEQLRAYFGGQLTRFDLTLETGGTPFQRRLWAALQEIPYGETVTYAALAVELGEPRAVRAVGAANGRNPVSIVIPCHRVLGSDGQLTGYGGGLPRKRWLLAHERAYATPFFPDRTPEGTTSRAGGPGGARAESSRR
jgi:methylated-DNA-[protein]-cysteine S-methyltransferase